MNQTTDLSTITLLSKDSKCKQVIKITTKFFTNLFKNKEVNCTYQELQQKADSIGHDILRGNFLKAVLS